jgi:krueppel-like factor 4
MGKFLLKGSQGLRVPDSEYRSPSVVSVSKASPDCSHPVVGVAPYSGGPLSMCPKVKQMAVSSCTVGWPLEAHLGAGPPLSNAPAKRTRLPPGVAALQLV